jgi:hypothetical protein
MEGFKMNKTKLYQRTVRALLDLTTNLYDAVSIIKEKRGEELVVSDPNDYDLVGAIERATQINKPSEQDFTELNFAMKYAARKLQALEAEYEEVRELSISSEQLSFEEEKEKKVSKPSNKLLAMQYHGATHDVRGDEI